MAFDESIATGKRDALANKLLSKQGPRAKSQQRGESHRFSESFLRTTASRRNISMNSLTNGDW